MRFVFSECNCNYISSVGTSELFVPRSGERTYKIRMFSFKEMIDNSLTVEIMELREQQG